MGSFLFAIVTLLSGFGIFLCYSQEITFLEPSVKDVTVLENEVTLINCTAVYENITDANELLFVVWFDSNSGSVSDNSFDDTHQIKGNSSSNGTHVFGESILNITGKVVNQEFSKEYTCVAQTNYSTSIISVTVNLEVRLSYNCMGPSYTCLNTNADLSCTFHGYPDLEASWSETNDGIAVNESSRQQESFTTTLYILEATSSKSYSCNARARGSTTEAQLYVIVRDDILSNITLKQGAEKNRCELSWGSNDVPEYAQSYLVQYSSNGRVYKLQIMRVNDSDYTETYQFDIDSPINNLTVALVMNECVGPSVPPDGTCNFDGAMQDNPFKLTLIIVGSVLGVAVLFLLGVVIFMCYQKGRKPKSLNGKGERMKNRYVSQRTVKREAEASATSTFNNMNQSYQQETQDSANEVVYEDVAVGQNEQPQVENRIKMPRGTAQSIRTDEQIYHTDIPVMEENYIDMQGQNLGDVYIQPEDEEIYVNETPNPVPKNY